MSDILDRVLLPSGWEDFFLANRTLINRILDTIIQSDIYILPEPHCVFDIFYSMHPDDVRLVMFGQDPHPGKCPLTHRYYACGVAFGMHEQCKVMPPLFSDMCNAISDGFVVDKQLHTWIEQGVFLANVGWTRGLCTDMRESHMQLWEEFSRNLVRWISEHNDRIVFAFFGARAWALDEEVIRKDLVVKLDPKHLKTWFQKIGKLVDIRWNTILQNSAGPQPSE
jgi:uracil DNA glycosylase